MGLVTAAILRVGCFEYKAPEIEAIVKKMMNDGSRYRNLEQTLGPGTSMVLGTNLPESVCVKNT